MRRLHFETLRPCCPRCRADRGLSPPLRIASVAREVDDAILEGVLHCTDDACRHEYPIVDGIPILLPRAREFVAANLPPLLARDDLSETMEGLLGDCAGPGSTFDSARQHVSICAFDHYGDLDPAEPPAPDGPRPGATLRCLRLGLDLLGPAGARPAGPVVDLGCAVGRATFELAARTGGPVLGVDVSIPMLRLAQRALLSGRILYSRRRVGLVYDRREFPVALPGADRVDFWACDAQAPPFADGTFGFAAALNLLDCVASPVALLQSIGRVLAPGGAAVLSTPYDWTTAATPLEGWVGGHSQRGEHRGAGEPLLRALLTPDAHPQSIPGLTLVGEIAAVPWTARIHDRCTVSYFAHVLSVRKQA